ncbi:MAG: hypothetical protein Q8R37_03060 [Nanoarchaeota archaeon]|nr:hypothetical protein [Nanoarchaeota archaeon]
MIKPTEQEIWHWLFDVRNHTLRVEYFCDRLGVGSSDPQRPHDIMGKGNKLSWDVMKGLALHYRATAAKTSSLFFQQHVKPSLEFHRHYQYHHQMWNDQNPTATVDSLKMGAVDAVCSLLENRSYQGGRHSYDEISAIAEEDPPHQREWMIDITREMRKIEQPRIPTVVGKEKELLLFTIPGISAEVDAIIRERFHETLQMLRQDHGYTLE